MLEAASMTNAPHDEAAQQQARALAQDPANAAPAAVEALPEALALTVLEAAVRARSPALPAGLLDSPRKAVAKAAKKALYQLRSLGVEVPQPKPAPKPAAAPAAPPEEQPGLVSPITGTGERAVLVTRAARGGLEMFQAVVSDEQGLLQLGAQQIPRSVYRKQLAEIRRGAAGAVEVPREEALALLADAAAANLASKTPFPQQAEEALRLLGISPSASAPPPLPAPEPDDERISREGHFLHNEPELLPWLPTEDELRRVAQKADEVVHSPLQLSDAQKNEQVLAAFHGAARAYFDERVSRLYARRLWAMAQYFERTGRERPAQLARAEARRLFHGHREPFSRFAEFLYEKVLLLSQRAQAAEGGLPAPGTSAPLAEQGAPPAERRSPGGLILP